MPTATASSGGRVGAIVTRTKAGGNTSLVLKLLFAVFVLSLLTSCTSSVMLASRYWRFTPTSEAPSGVPYSRAMKSVLLEHYLPDDSYRILNPDGTAIPLPHPSPVIWNLNGERITPIKAQVSGRYIGGFSLAEMNTVGYDGADVYWSPSGGPMVVNLHTVSPSSVVEMRTAGEGMRRIAARFVALAACSVAVFVLGLAWLRRRWRISEQAEALAVQKHRKDWPLRTVYEATCPLCGAPRVQDAPYCPYCGDRLVILTPEQTTALVTRMAREGS